jgi:hypothetical protein
MGILLKGSFERVLGGIAVYRADIGHAYEQFLELPTPVVLLALWAVGVALIGLCVVELYALYWNGMALMERGL